MRKALLVIAMVAASFAGGAVVNGPGLAWFRAAAGLESRPIEPIARGNVLPAPGSEAGSALDAPVVQLDPEPPAPSATGAGPDLAPPTVAMPAASSDPEPPSAVREDAGASAVAEAATTPDAGPRPLDLSTAPPPLAAPASKPSAPEPGWGDAPGSAPAVAVLPRDAGRPGSPAARLASASAPSPALEPAPSDPAVAPASLAGPAGTVDAEPEPEPSPAPPLSPPGPAASPSPSPSSTLAPAETPGWDDLVRRLESAGVGRYWVEGKPGGPVRLRCELPLTAAGSVSVHFEGEGPDLAAAADATIRRITLWRAAQGR